MLQKYRLWTGWTRISIFASVNYGYVSYAALVNDEGLVLTIWGEPPFFSHNYNIPPSLPTDGQLCVDMKRHQKKVYSIKNMLMNEIDLIFFAGACQLKSKQIYMHSWASSFWKMIHFCFSTILRIAKIAWFASHMMMHFTPYRNQSIDSAKYD